MRLVLHAGTHKTGTTAIQSALASRVDGLRDLGVLYHLAHRKSGPRNAHHWIAEALAVWSDDDRARLDAWREEVLASSARTAIISAEPFYRQIAGGGSVTFLDDPEIMERREEFLARTADFLSPFDTEVALYFRRPDSFAESAYRENTVRQPEIIDFPSFVAHRTHFFRYGHRLNDFARHFSNVTAFCYEAAARTGLVSAFLANSVLPALPGVDGERHVREGVSRRAAIWISNAKANGEVSSSDLKQMWTFALHGGAAVLKDDPRTTLWSDKNERLRFVLDCLDDFPQREFWDLSLPEDESVIWTAADHCEANEVYTAWVRLNRSVLAGRLEKGVPAYAPFPSDPIEKNGAARRGIARLLRWARQPGRSD